VLSVPVAAAIGSHSDQRGYLRQSRIFKLRLVEFLSGAVAESFFSLCAELAQVRSPYLGSVYSVALAMALGDALGNLGYALSSLWIPSALVPLAVLLFLCKRRQLGLLATLVALLLASSISARSVFLATANSRLLCGCPDGASVTLDGRLLREPEANSGNLRLLIEVERANFDQRSWRSCRGLVRATVLGSGNYEVGEKLRLAGRLRFPRNFGNPGEFDYEAYMARSGIMATLLVRDPQQIVVIGRAPNSLWTRIARVRRRIRAFIDSNLPDPQREEMRAVTIGERGDLARDVQEKFAVTGMTHLLVISGLHMGFVAGSVFVAARFVLSLWPRLLIFGAANKLAALAAALAAIGYALIAGHHVSTLRALIMVVSYALAVVFDRSRSSLAALSIAAVIILFAFPGSTGDISFQLSFASVLAIVLGMRRYVAWWKVYQAERLLRLRQSWPVYQALGWLGGYLALSWYVTLGVSALTAYHFNQVSLISPLANAVVVPIMGLVGTVGGLLASALSFVAPKMAAVLLRSAGQFMALGTALASHFAALKWAWIRFFTPTFLEIGIWFGLLMVWLTRPLKGGDFSIVGSASGNLTPSRSVKGSNRNLMVSKRQDNGILLTRPRWRRVVCFALCTLLAVDAGWWTYERFLNPTLRVVFLSVGQGDAAVVQFPGSRVMVIDGGGGLSPVFDPGERLVARYLWSRKIMTVNYLVLSHPDFDHFGGLVFLARNFAPKEYWTTQVDSSSHRYLVLLTALARNGATRLRLLNDSSPVRVISGVEVRCLNPAANRGSLRHNDASLVLLITFGKERVMFTGDIEAAAERALVQHYAGALEASVLKVPHHGSETSSTAAFVETVRPKLAVVSVGHLNQFHFPAPTVIERYRRSKARVLRTDELGAVMLQITPRSLKLRTWRLEGG